MSCPRNARDLIVHCPDNSDHNTVVVEAKGYWNLEPREHDREKLLGYLETLQYTFAYLDEFLPDHATFERVMLE